MPSPELVAIPTKVAPGMLPSERFFTVKLADGTEHRGLAPRYFFWNAKGELVGENEPTQEVDGMVAARALQRHHGYVSVEVPDGELIAVNSADVRLRPTVIWPPGSSGTAATEPPPMYLSDRDLVFAVRSKQLIFYPEPTEYDTTSIDVHLDSADKAMVWDLAAFEGQQRRVGQVPAALRVGEFEHEDFAKEFLKPVPDEGAAGEEKVYRAGGRVFIKPGGFFLWQTKEVVGTPEIDPRLICFLNGKSSIARTGLLVHITAPTIHAGWWGNITLELSNLGPFTLELRQGDAIAQIVVAAISSPPTKRKKVKGVPIGQTEVSGQAGTSPTAGATPGT